ncbi:MAG: alpha/beta hydrolase [Chloroflexi bacterium]|nr:alpha/beta hydrolase [Chloroflexota bacterium]
MERTGPVGWAKIWLEKKSTSTGWRLLRRSMKGYNLVYFDLRACGKSGGSTITLGKEEANDLVGVINWIMANKQAKDGQALNGIGLLGMSMGGNVALRGAIQLQETFVDNLAVVSIGAYRYDTMVEKSIKFWTALPDFFIPFIKHAAKQQLGFDPSTEIDPARYVGQIDATPVIYIQAEKDEIGDLADARAIFQQATDPKELIILPDALRFDAYRYPAEHPEKILSFFADHILS